MKWESLGDITVLIADDDAFNRQLVVSLLDKIPTIHFLEAEDGVEALEILAQKSVDMILLDLHMPKMDGYDTIHNIRKEAKYDFTPIVIITTDEQEMNKLYAMGADDFISKPFKLSELSSRIYAHIEKKQYRAKYNQLSKEEIDTTLISTEAKEKEQTTQKIDEDLNKHSQNYTIEDIEISQKETFYNMIKLSVSKKSMHNIIRVATLSKALSKLIGYDDKKSDNIYFASMLRNIGAILSIEKNKKTDYQYLIAGYSLINNSIDTEFIKVTKQIMTQYREHFDGSGFPKQRKENEIYISAYIVSIVEAFDDLCSNLDTKKDIRDSLKAGEAKNFHPKITKLFLTHFDYFFELRKKIIKQISEKKEYA
ncbi:MAG TPA: response regulator [Campylobacterales bacterium]|nr:response regulator [Campylobacterales bacterium]